MTATNTQLIAPLRDELLVEQQSQRVDEALLTSDGEVRETQEGGGSEGEKARFRHVFMRIAETAGILNEQVIRLGERHIEEQIHEMDHGGTARWGKLGSLTQVQAAANLLVGLLGLSDEELLKELKGGHGKASQVAAGSELTKYLVSTAAGMTSLTAAFASVVAKEAGNARMASKAAALAQETVLTAGKLVAGVEIIHDIVVLGDGGAAGAQKEGAAVGLAGNAVWLAGHSRGVRTSLGLQEPQEVIKAMGEVEASEANFAIEGVEATSSGIGLVLLASYEELEFIASEYGAARIGLAGGLYRALPTLAKDADRLAKDAARVAKAAVLCEREPNDERRRALRTVRKRANLRLARDIDDFLRSVGHVTQQGKMEYPGNWSAIRAEFAELQRYRGVTNPALVPVAAKEILEKICWCGQHPQYLVGKTAGLSMDRPSDRTKQAGGDEE